MYRRIEDFAADWEQDARTTIRVLDAIPDAALARRVHSGGRSLGRLGWHLAETVPEMMGHAGVAGVAGPEPQSATPASAAEIRDAYQRASVSLLPALRAAWTDDLLDGEVEMYGERWKRGSVLTVLLMHQAHHRGQMTVLMRQAGVVVPGCFGPAAEEWAAMGLPPMA